jgi:hypothetical protein
MTQAAHLQCIADSSCLLCIVLLQLFALQDHVTCATGPRAASGAGLDSSVACMGSSLGVCWYSRRALVPGGQGGSLLAKACWSSGQHCIKCEQLAACGMLSFA